MPRTICAAFQGSDAGDIATETCQGESTSPERGPAVINASSFAADILLANRRDKS